MRTAHLFAGVGGGILADLILGHTPVVAVENNPFACQILRERFPDLRVIESDVRAVDFTTDLVGIDAICAGFPCQDISVAGKGVGITGERSGLYREVMRAIDAVRPEWVFLENSPNIRTKGRHVVIGDLVARGYSWRDGSIGAVDVGAPHRRRRWFCLARLTNPNRIKLRIQSGRSSRADRENQKLTGLDGSSQSLAITNSIDANADPRKERRGQSSEEGHDTCRGGEVLANPVGERLEVAQPRETGKEQSAIEGTCRHVGWWSAEPGMGRMAHGVPDRPHRSKGLGNAQVPLQAAAAWRLLGGP